MSTKPAPMKKLPFSPFGRILVIVTMAATCWVLNSSAAEPPLKPLKTEPPRVEDNRLVQVAPSPDSIDSLKQLRVAPGLKLDLFAGEPLIQNCSNFAFDEKGRVYVVETFRRRTSVYDIRKHRTWTDNDLSFQTVDDRIRFLKQQITPSNPDLPNDIIVDRNRDGVFDWRDLEVESERIRLIEDTDGNGVADTATTFAEDFRTIVSGVAAGVLARNGNVWFTCIPDLWLLKDTDGDGVADVRTNLLHGFGVHIGYGGHDMHGLRFGPDGRIYFSIADRGTHVETAGKVIALPHTGAVFRCNPDGSEFEVVTTGLRNPQELAFDDHGNLFTGDNNADGGDKARWEYIVEGADYGWRYGWQHMARLGAWNSERLWHLAPTNTAAYLLPPVAHISHGPAGTAYYPGTGMPEKFKGHFVLADFPGGVRHFAVKQSGATFTADNPDEYLQNNRPDVMEGKVLWNLSPTDVDFAPGGGIYVLDWVEGWEKTGKGRLFRVHDPAADNDPATLETKRLLAEGMEGRPLGELADFLGHRDQRVRQSAQFGIVEASGRKVWRWKGLEVRLSKDEALNTLLKVARSGTNPLARLHAIWGIGQISRMAPPSGLYDLTGLLRDKDSEVRTQVIKILGEAKYNDALPLVTRALLDPEPRVRFQAGIALGRLGSRQALPAVLTMLKENDDRDAYLRHAGVMALTGMRDADRLSTMAQDRSRPLRMAALLALRRLERPDVARFLNDTDPAIAVEAARAINDVPINSAMPQLAAAMTTAPRVFGADSKVSSDISTPFFRRALNASFRLGTKENAAELARFAAMDAAPEALRVEALTALGDWRTPSGRDRIVGLWRPLDPREPAAAGAALQSVLKVLLDKAPSEIRIAAVNAAGKLMLTDAGPLLHGVLADTSLTSDLRVAALGALSAMGDKQLGGALKLAQGDKSESLRREASRLAGSAGGGGAVALATTLEKGSVGEKQAALTALADIKGPEADRLILQWATSLAAGSVPAELQLDILEAAGKRTSEGIKAKLQAFESSRKKGDDLAPYREALLGGDARVGRTIFYERAEAGCARCHKVKGEGGDLGPDLAGVVEKRGRDYVLESIVLPNKQIAQGFETLVVTMNSGETHSGLVKSETPTDLVLNSPDDGLLKLKIANIKARARGLSTMPEGLPQILSKRDIRDLIQFLSEAKP
jgi:quinoprotein glucose dehydrogenase